MPTAPRQKRTFEALRNRHNQPIDIYIPLAMVDEWNDYDYSVVMFLINNKNQKPFILTGYRYGDTILTNNNMFHSTQSTIPLKVEIKKGTIPVGIQGQTVTQYLLTDEFYGACCTIIKETGNLSHFDRKTIDLHQEDQL